MRVLYLGFHVGWQSRVGFLLSHQASQAGNFRVEYLASVNSGATVGGNPVVKDNVIARGHVNLSGSVVASGGAAFAIACSAGPYLLVDSDRGCDGCVGESNIS